MKITETEVRYVADLANLRLSDEEIGRFAHDLDHILTHMDRLNEIDTADVEPMAQVLYGSDETSTLRPDVEHEPLSNEEALANAPLGGAGCYKVPLVIER